MSVRERIFPFLLSLAFVFEPLAPRFVSYYVKRNLKEWKEKGLVLDYKTKTKRIGKFHYKTEIEFFLDSEQINYALVDLVNWISKTVRR